MAGPHALHIAIALLADPALVRAAQRARLPQEVTSLLQVAIGEDAAIAKGRIKSGLERAALQEAADFFIEQVLLDYHADSYRTLGSHQGASHEELRRHMALLMRWLHPDLNATQNPALANREIFVTRVSRAWEDLKSDERRNAYHRRQPPPPNSAPAKRRNSRVRHGGQRSCQQEWGLRHEPSKLPDAKDGCRLSLWKQLLQLLGKGI